MWFIPSEINNVAELNNIPGLGPEQAELIEALGIEKLSALAQSDPGELFGEMQKANARLQLIEGLPDLDDLIAWIEKARELVGQEGPPLVTRLDEIVELVPIEVLIALPVQKESILKSQIGVDDVPIMDEFLAERDLYVEQTRSIDSSEPPKVAVREIAPKALVVRGCNEQATASSAVRPKVEPLKRNTGFDIRKTASPELNEGKKSHSRAYIRGVLHPQPTRVTLGAVFSVTTLVLFPLTFVAGGLGMVFHEHKDSKWLLLVPAAFLISGLFYLMFSRPMKCRICGQPLFSPKACGRHVKAHRLPFLGYILPTSLHMLVYHWFRCIFCGTSVRLKK